MTGNSEASSSVPLSWVQIEKIENIFFCLVPASSILPFELFVSESLAHSFCALNTTEGNKIHLFHLQKVFCPVNPLVYWKERSIANDYKLLSSEWLIITVRSSCSWGRWREIVWLMSAGLCADLCSLMSISGEWWTTKTRCSSATLIAG